MRTHRRRRHRRGGRQNNVLLVKLIAIFSILLFALIMLDSRMRPMVHTVAQTQAKNMATKLINDAVDDIIDEEQVTYQNLVTIEKTDDNAVTSVQANVLKMNRLKARIGNHVAEKLTGVQNRKLKIPLGSFMGSGMLSGRGPDITVYISLAGSVITNINSAFSSAGINQTLHSINLDVEIDINIIIPGFNTSTKIKTAISLAQTVIVGATPEAFASINASLDGLLSGQANQK